MESKTYIRQNYVGANGITYLLVSLFIGAIPAAVILLRAELIDLAAEGRAGAEGGTFFFLLAVFVLSSLAAVALQAVSSRLLERHKIRQAAKLDLARVGKASRVDFSVAESGRFHLLWSKAAAAAEADGSLYQSVGDIARTAARLFLSLLVIAAVDGWTALGIAFLLALGVLLSSLYAGTTEGFWSKYIEKMRRADYFSSLLLQREFAAERKIFAYDGEISRRYGEEFEKAKRQNAKAGKKRLSVEVVMQILSALYSAAVVLLLLRPLLAGAITVGAFTSVFYAAVGMMSAGRQLYAGVYAFTESGKRLGGYFEFLSLPEEGQGGLLLKAPVRRIEWKNVTFTYPGGKAPVLRDVSFTLEEGKHYALVGENGCGKTTLVKLLLGLYEPDSGEILADGVSVSALAPSERRKLFAAVFQQPYRYPLSIRENVSLSAESALSDEAIRGIFAKLDLSPAAAEGGKRYDAELTPLKQGGAGLSGGEWQKLAVARCLLSSAPVAVLDEPNAALDPVAEAELYEVYRKLLSDRTTLFISHRFGCVCMSDEIMVLKDGGLLAKAPHETLLSSCAYYAALFDAQKEMYDEKDV